MRKRIAIFSSHPGDACSYYRSFGVFARLREEYDLEPVILKDVSWPSLSFIDMVYCSRPDSMSHINIIKMAKFMGKKVWIDYDDDLLNVPQSNPAFPYYAKNSEFVATALRLADLVTVTSVSIKETYSQYNDNIEIVPNAIDERLVPKVRRDKKSPTKTVVWRGSNTHFKDLYDFRDEIIYVMKQRKDWKILFLGMAPWFITEQLPESQYGFYETMDILHYFELIGKIMPDVMIVPLSDNKFNRGKSNIAYLEGVMAGASVVAPNWDGWPILRTSYENPETFESSFLLATSQEHDTLKDNKNQWEVAIHSNSLEAVNGIRYRLIKELLG